MKKFCPNCGQPLSEHARFCPKCGYNVAKYDESLKNSDDSTNAKQAQKPQPVDTQPKQVLQEAPRREQRRETNRNLAMQGQPHKSKRRKIIIITVIVVLICIVGGFLYYQHNSNSNNTSNIPSTSSSSANQSSRSTSESSSNNFSSSTKLSQSMGPKETAAAITCYAANHGSKSWKGLLDDSDNLTVKLDQDQDHIDKLNIQGTGMAYDVFGYHDLDSDDDTEFVYTLDNDNTINIYQINGGIDAGDSGNDPLESISKSDLIDWLNDNGYVSKVKAISRDTVIDK